MVGQQNTMQDGDSQHSYQHPNFKTLTRFTTDYYPIEISKFESLRTGMSIVVVNKESPKISGQFVLATEIFDDSGAPHTLEHLIFLGSKNYRYKGILDKFATRAYSGTNAWTATDHTAYTLDTAGWEGFAQILPVYLEHVMLPILTDSGCYTEVHHIDGTGHDAGVVYSEMQGVQNDQDTLMSLEANRQLYPPGVGFRSETGGMMEQLRVLTADRIRAFHKEMYQPKNMCLVILGSADVPNLLEVVSKFEDGILDEVPKLDAPWRRPWVESPPVPRLKESITRKVDFPEKDESMGSIMVAFLGPSCTDLKDMAAMKVLSAYLAGSSVSVLEKKLVEIEEPYSSGVIWYLEERPDSVIWFELASVPVGRLEEAEKKLFEVLGEVVSNPLDFEYLTDCLHRAKRQKKFNAEGPAHGFSKPVISDFLFAARDGSGLKQLQSLSTFDELAKWSEQDWRDYIRKWLVDNPHVTVLGRPSAALADKIENDEKQRVADQIAKFGPEGLENLAKKLEQAKKDNDPEIPIDVLRNFKTPGVESIHFIRSETGGAGIAKASKIEYVQKVQKILENDTTKTLPFPLYIHFEHVPSNFVSISLVVSTGSTPVHLRPLLPLYFEYMFASAITLEDGTKLEYEKFVAQLEKDTVGLQAYSGKYIHAGETVRLKIDVEPEKYATAIKWLKLAIWNMVFEPERLNVLAKKILSDIPEEKRDGSDMSWEIAAIAEYNEESIGYALNTLSKGKYIKQYSKLLTSNPEEAIAQMAELRDTLYQLENIKVLVIANVEKLPKPVSEWEAFVDGKKFTGAPAPIDRRLNRLTPLGKKPGDCMYLVPMPTLDSSFGVFSALGPASYDDPRLPALMLAISYLDAVEGPLWRAIRGTGLAYGSGFSRRMDSGHIEFSIYRSPDAYKAYEMAKKIVTGYADGTTAFDEFDLDGAISTVVSATVDVESTLAAAATTSFILQVIHGQPKDYNARQLRKVRAVKVDEIRQVMTEVLLPIFDPKTALGVVTTAPVNTDSLKERFEKAGFPVEVRNLASFTPKSDDKTEDDDEDDDDDDDMEDASGDEEGSDEE